MLRILRVLCYFYYNVFWFMMYFPGRFSSSNYVSNYCRTGSRPDVEIWFCSNWRRCLIHRQRFLETERILFWCSSLGILFHLRYGQFHSIIMQNQWICQTPVASFENEGNFQWSNACRSSFNLFEMHVGTTDDFLFCGARFQGWPGKKSVHIFSVGQLQSGLLLREFRMR